MAANRCSLTREHCGTCLVEWSPALESTGLDPGSELCSLSHATLLGIMYLAYMTLDVEHLLAVGGIDGHGY